MVDLQRLLGTEPEIGQRGQQSLPDHTRPLQTARDMLGSKEEMFEAWSENSESLRHFHSTVDAGLSGF